MSEILNNNKNVGGGNDLTKSDESWEEHVEKANKLIVDLEKPMMRVRKGDKIVEQTVQLTKTHTSEFNRYPEQGDLIKNRMQEAYKNGKPLRVLDIGLAQGQEALGYVQTAADVAGESAISDALDLELVEYAVEIPIIKDRPDNITQNSVDYLEDLYKSPKAHFDTPFQGFVQEMVDKNEKRDVVLFNNVIQHLDYNVPEEKMLKDMENLVDVVDENGILCMTCERSMLNSRTYPKIRELFDSTVDVLRDKGFIEVSDGIFQKTKGESQGE